MRLPGSVLAPLKRSKYEFLMEDEPEAGVCLRKKSRTADAAQSRVFGLVYTEQKGSRGSSDLQALRTLGFSRCNSVVSRFLEKHLCRRPAGLARVENRNPATAHLCCHPSPISRAVATIGASISLRLSNANFFSREDLARPELVE